ncbi:MAG: sigma-70 domain-containing protein [Lachnospiraceae bacterium]|nr:sigma-70 domain-containing protein [Lachnospiraceae bacterium]
MGVSQEILFAQTLEKVRKLAKEQQNCVSKEQVEEAFAQLELSQEQLQMVFDYLKAHKVGIGEPVDLDEYLSEEEVDYLEEYKKELELIEQVSEGEKEAITLSAMAGETQAQKKLIHLYLPQVVEISKLYTGQGVFLEDLIGEGNVALSMGVTMLGCLEHAREAEGMLIKMIMDAMESIIDETLQETDKDKRVVERVNKVADKAKELAEELHRKVTVDELAEETGMSKKAIQDAMRMSGFAIEDIEG